MAALRAHRYALHRPAPQGFGWRLIPLRDEDLPAGDGFLNAVAVPEERGIQNAAMRPIVARAASASRS